MEQTPTATKTDKRLVLGTGVLLAALILFVAGVQATGMYTRSQQTAAASAPFDAFSAVSIEARGAYVYDVREGNALYEKNADIQLPLASLTKIPLMLVVSEVLDPGDVTIISRQAIERGEGGGLGTGDMWRIRDLIDFTLMRSSNAGAEALAEAADEALRGTYPAAPEGGAALWRMNELAKELGLSKTYFANVSGLDVSSTQPGAMGSARDMALVFGKALSEKPDLFAGTSDRGAYLGPLNGYALPTNNTNDALPEIPGLIMGKTGYTDLAGGNLAIVFDVGPGHPIIAVVLGSTYDGRFDDIRELVHAASAAVTQGP